MLTDICHATALILLAYPKNRKSLLVLTRIR